MSSPLSAVDEVELRSRIDSVLGRLDSLFKEIGPKIREVGNLREEAEMIYRELERRSSEKDGT